MMNVLSTTLRSQILTLASRSSCKKSTTTTLIVSFPARHSRKTGQRRQDTENQATLREELDKFICLYTCNIFSNSWLPNKIISDKNLEELWLWVLVEDRVRSVFLNRPSTH